MAVRKLKNDEGTYSLLCLEGPPTEGWSVRLLWRTKSVARAMDRKLIRLSLGGVRDESAPLLVTDEDLYLHWFYAMDRFGFLIDRHQGLAFGNDGKATLRGAVLPGSNNPV